MQKNFLRYILVHSWRAQLKLIFLIGVSLPFYYVSLEIPKTIINDALGVETSSFPHALKILGFEFGRFEQVALLVALCTIFLAIVVINGAFKYVINVYKGFVGERVLCDLREELSEAALRFTGERRARLSAGELVSMVTAEVEALGGFVGDALATPLFQGGLLVTAITFIYVQDPLMGVAATWLLPIQAIIIPRLQTRVNHLGRKRVREMRRLSRRITESSTATPLLQGNDLIGREMAVVQRRLGRIFDIRYEIYRRKFFIKFLNNFLAQLTPFFFFSIGGFLVLREEMSIGALVASLSAYKDLPAPWKELLDYYQQQQDARIKYQQIVMQFIAGTAIDGEERRIVFKEENDRFILALSRDGGNSARLATPDSPQFAVSKRKRTLIRVNSAGSAAEMSEALLTIACGDKTLIPNSAAPVFEISFVSRNPAFFTGTLLDNLAHWLPENHQKDPWPHVEKTLNAVDFEHELYSLGLRAHLDQTQYPELAAKIVAARRALAKQFSDRDLASIVEPYDFGRYHTRSRVLDNLVFGVAADEVLDSDALAEDPRLLRLMRKAQLSDSLQQLGREVATRLCEAEPNDELMEDIRRDVFIAQPDYIPLLKSAIARSRRGDFGLLDRADRRLLISLALQLNLDRHCRSSDMSELKAKIVAARPLVRRILPSALKSGIQPFDRDSYNSALTVRANLVFGRVNDAVPDADARLEAAVTKIVEEYNLQPLIKYAGMAFHVGVAGQKLSPKQQSKLSLARALLRPGNFAIVDDPLTDFPDSERAILICSFLGACPSEGIVWISEAAIEDGSFDAVISHNDS